MQKEKEPVGRLNLHSINDGLSRKRCVELQGPGALFFRAAWAARVGHRLDDALGRQVTRKKSGARSPHSTKEMPRFAIPILTRNL